MYSAAERSGTIVSGTREAESEKTLARALKQDGLFLLEAHRSGKNAVALPRHASTQIKTLMDRIRRVGVVEKMFFARTLAVMVKAGLPLTRALEALGEQTSNRKFKRVIADISDSLIKGNPFAASLRLHTEVFSDLFINMVEVGETTGKLSLVLTLLANQMKKDYDIRKRMKGALIYPAIVVTTLVGIGGLMMVYVIPALSQTIKELGVELPLSTRIIIAISDLMSHYALFVLMGILVCGLLFWRLLKLRMGKELFDRVVLGVPLFGTLIQQFNMARFSRSLSYLVTAGVPIIKSLEITSRVVGNTLYRKAIAASAGEIQKGTTLGEILGKYPKLFHPVMIQMIKVGEETGTMGNMLLRLALFFEEDVATTTRNFSTIIEPFLMIFIGAVVGFFAVSMLQPIYSSLGSIQ